MVNPLDPFDADDERNALTEKQKEALRQVDEDLKWIMRHQQGRRFMWRLLQKTGVYRTTFRTNSEMAFLEGWRAVGVAYVADCHRACLEDTITMMREHSNG